MQKKFKENKSESAPVVSSLPLSYWQISENQKKRKLQKYERWLTIELQDGNKPKILSDERILTMYSNTYSNYQLVLWFASMPWSPMQIN